MSHKNEGASLRPSDCVRDPDYVPWDDEVEPAPDEAAARRLAADVTGLRLFKPGGAKDDRISPVVPNILRLSLESLVRVAGRPVSVNDAALWSLHRGLNRLEVMPEVQTIRGTWKALIDCGADPIGLLHWPYRVGNGETSRLTLRYINERVMGKWKGLEKELGLNNSALGSIAMICGIVDVTLPGAQVPLSLRAEFSNFRRSLKQRASVAATLRQVHALAAPAVVPRPITFEALLNDE